MSQSFAVSPACAKTWAHFPYNSSLKKGLPKFPEFLQVDFFSECL